MNSTNTIGNIPEKHQTKKQPAPGNIAKTSRNTETVPGAPAMNVIVNNNSINVPAAGNEPVPVTIDTGTTTAALPVISQKQLKVVHINELGETNEFPAAIARNTDLHLFQLKLAEQEIYNTSSMASSHSSFSFKPKKSSN